MDLQLCPTSCALRLLIKSSNLHRHSPSGFFRRHKDNCGRRYSPNFSPKLYSGCWFTTKALAGQNQTKRSRKQGKKKTTNKDSASAGEQASDEYDGLDKPFSGSNYVEDGKTEVLLSDALEDQTSVTLPSRNAVLQACIITSGFMGALALLIRQVSHIASTEGWPVVDCSAAITLSVELWHLELIAGSVLLISSFRFMLLKTWPDFAESSNAANHQVLTSLEPLDYLVIAFLPGISEELLFRGALLPLLGTNSTSILAVAMLFGVLHLGSGRNYSFAIWATFVGLLYGYATVLSASIIVPIASHALNNLVGGIIWRYLSSSSSKPTG